MAILEVRNLKKIYTTRFGGNQVQALADLNFSVEKGEYVAIMGESGSGKTTLLNILAALDKPTAGEVLLNNKNIVTLGEREISKFRRENLGFVFQDFNLLDHFSLKDNILLPLVLADAPVLVLDEATAFSDAEHERRIEAVLSQACGDKTRLVIAHRLQTICDADQICVLDGGRVQDIGTHEELLARCAIYKRLWQANEESDVWQIEESDEP